MNRRLVSLLALALCLGLPAGSAAAKKAKPRKQDRSAQPKPLRTIDVDESEGPEGLKEALREARERGSVRIVVHPTRSAGGPATSLAAPAATGYAPVDLQVNDPAYDTSLFTFHAEPSIAAQGDAVVCVYNDGGADGASPNPAVISNTDGWSVSSDGGDSWRDLGKRAPSTGFTSFNGDNVVAAGPDGDFFYLSDGGKANVSFSAMACSRSTDGGRTWTAATSPSAGVAGMADGFFDKGWIAVDRSSTPTRGNVYATWSDFGTSVTDLYVARSTDHGATWSAQKLDRFSHPVAVTYVQVAPNGLVYVGEQDEGTIVNGAFTGTNYVRVSADGGKTFGPLRSAGPYRSVGDPVANALCGDPNFFAGLVRYLKGPIEADSSLRIAVDPSDPSGQTVFVATQAIPDTPGDGSDVFLWRSTDGGLTWGAPVRVNDDRTATDQFMPDLWVAPDGTVGVLWLDRRNDPKADWRLEAWMALSKDHGASFGCSFPVSARAFPPVGRCQMSDYDGVFADEHGFQLAWGDSREVDAQKQMTFAIYGAKVPLEGPGPLLFVDAISSPAAGRFTLRLRNDGTADATALTVAVSVDGNQIAAPTVLQRFPDVPACHGTAEATLTVPYATANAWLSGTVSVAGPRGAVALPFAAPKPPGVPAGLLLAADFESGTGDFIAQSPWHATSGCSAAFPGHGGTSAAFFGVDSLCGWAASSTTRTVGTLTSKVIALPPGGAVLRFKEAVGLAKRWGSDRLLVQISTDGGASFENLWGYGYMSRYVLDPSVALNDGSGNPAWHDVAIDLSDYAGSQVVLRFFGYVGANAGRGWAIDDVKIAATSDVPNGAPGTCAAPQALDSVSSLSVKLVAQTAAASDPVPSCAGSSGLHQPYWATYTPPVDGTYRFDACTDVYTSGFLSAWSGSCGTLTELSCTPIFDCGSPLPPMAVTVQGHAGVPIRLLVSSSSEAGTTVFLHRQQYAEGTLVPIVLDVPPGRAHYTTELALTNHAGAGASLSLTYTAALGSGSGTVPETLAAGRVLTIADVLAYLRGKGLAIPTTGAQAGTLRIVANGDGVPAGSVSAVARTLAATSSPQPAGAASLAYAAVPLASASRVTVFGLRSDTKDRGKLALFNPSTDPVALKVTVVSGAGDGKRVVYREGEALAPGGWIQYDGILDEAGIANGWAIVERTSAAGTAGAYGVVNDDGTNDGSYLPAVTSSGAATSLTVPVLVETPRFASELVLANQGSTDATLTLRYLESLDGAGGSAAATVVLPAGTQRILSDAFAFLRASGATFGPKGGSYAGALRIDVSGAAPGDVWAAARVTAPSPAGGAFGLFVPAVYAGSEAGLYATVDGLRADAANRSNVAVVNAGDEAITLRLQAYDGATGAPRGAALDVALPGGGWAQPADFFKASGAASGWVTVTRVSGTAPWIAYGVVNDGAQPGARTDDGAFVAMRP